MELDKLLNLIIASVALIISLLNSIYIYKKMKSITIYSNIDGLYLELLKLGIEHPKFVNPEYTSDYINKFEDCEKRQYELYAFIAWNICETIFDRRNDFLTFKSWEPVLRHEAKLHREWFEGNQDKFKEEFKRYVINNKQLA